MRLTLSLLAASAIALPLVAQSPLDPAAGPAESTRRTAIHLLKEFIVSRAKAESAVQRRVWAAAWNMARRFCRAAA